MQSSRTKRRGQHMFFGIMKNQLIGRSSQEATPQEISSVRIHKKGKLTNQHNYEKRKENESICLYSCAITCACQLPCVPADVPKLTNLHHLKRKRRNQYSCICVLLLVLVSRRVQTYLQPGLQSICLYSCWQVSMWMYCSKGQRFSKASTWNQSEYKMVHRSRGR